MSRSRSIQFLLTAWLLNFFHWQSIGAKIITVQVGSPLHQFAPDVVNAEVDDTIEFKFMSTVHSVVRSQYKTPCAPIQAKGGFSTGMITAKVENQEFPTRRFRINNTDPIFYYCSAPSSCNEFQMVGVINPGNNSFEEHKALAKGAKVYQPGDEVPPELVEASESSSSSASSASPSASPYSTSGSSPSGSHIHLSTAAIVGIVVGGAAVLILATALFFFIGRSRSLKEAANRQSSTIRHESLFSPRQGIPMNPTFKEAPIVYPGYGFQKSDYAQHQRQPPEYYPHHAEEGANLRTSTMSPVSTLHSPTSGNTSTIQELDASDNRPL